MFYGVSLTDSHNGLRALSRKAAQAIEIGSDDMAHASEIVEEVARKHLKYVEVPVTIKYSGYSMGKGQPTLNGLRILFKMFWNKLIR